MGVIRKVWSQMPFYEILEMILGMQSLIKKKILGMQRTCFILCNPVWMCTHMQVHACVESGCEHV